METPRINPALVNPLAPTAPASAPAPVRPSGAPEAPGRDFSRVLGQQVAAEQIGIRFSKHALQRLDRRDIQIEPTQMQRLGQAVDQAAGKGSRSAMVLVDDLAFVVAVPNRTVITAIDRAHMTRQVFTNIDTAVLG